MSYAEPGTSGSMTLQLALDVPGSCTLSPSWKPRPPPTDTQQRFGKNVTQAAAQPHRTGHPGQGGRSLSSAGIYESGYRPALDAGLPRGFEQAAAGAGAVLHPPLDTEAA